MDKKTNRFCVHDSFQCLCFIMHVQRTWSEKFRWQSNEGEVEWEVLLACINHKT